MCCRRRRSRVGLALKGQWSLSSSCGIQYTIVSVSIRCIAWEPGQHSYIWFSRTFNDERQEEPKDEQWLKIFTPQLFLFCTRWHRRLVHLSRLLLSGMFSFGPRLERKTIGIWKITWILIKKEAWNALARLIHKIRMYNLNKGAWGPFPFEDKN